MLLMPLGMIQMRIHTIKSKINSIASSGSDVETTAPDSDAFETVQQILLKQLIKEFSRLKGNA